MTNPRPYYVSWTGYGACAFLPGHAPAERRLGASKHAFLLRYNAKIGEKHAATASLWLCFITAAEQYFRPARLPLSVAAVQRPHHHGVRRNNQARRMREAMHAAAVGPNGAAIAGRQRVHPVLVDVGVERLTP